jgi:predicted carbohydrate-binding protein with CBM5 and CBM33 domain
MKSFTSALALSSLLGLVSAHGFVTDPPARMPGTAMQKACGEQVAINQESDNYGNIQGELQVASSQSDYNEAACDIWLCKGYKFADNKANVQSYKPGQKVPITVDIRAPHTGGANVSIVDTATNTVIGSPLKSWKVYASNSSPIPAAQENFAITIPEDLGSQCATAGDCVIQWYWFAESIDQTYESCIDFTVDGSGSGSASTTTKKASSSSTQKPIKTATPSTTSTPSAPASTFVTSATSATSAATPPFYPPSNTTIPASSFTRPVPTSVVTSVTMLTSVTTVDVTVTVTGSNGVPTAIPSEVTSAVTSAVTTTVIPSEAPAYPTTVPTTTSVASQGTGSSSPAMPKGTTLEELLGWIWYKMRMLRQKESSQRRHARDLAW